MTQLRCRDFRWLDDHAITLTWLRLIPAENAATSVFDFGTVFGLAVTCYNGTEKRRHGIMTKAKVRNRRGKLGLLLLMERKLHAWVVQRGYSYLNPIQTPA